MSLDIFNVWDFCLNISIATLLRGAQTLFPATEFSSPTPLLVSSQRLIH